MAAKKKKRTSKKKKSRQSSNILLYTAWGLGLVALVLVSLVAGYYLGFSTAKEKAPKVAHSKEKELPKHTPKEPKVSVHKRLQEVLKKESKTYDSAAHEITNEALVNIKTQREVTPPLLRSKRPKLVIIIDDVSTRSQVKAIKELHMPLNMSFLPPSKARPNSAKLAAKEPFYMVHLPMEAMHFNKEEPYTLRVSDSQQDILRRVAAIKELFPKVAYINNHTGSKFTSNEIAMNRLFVAFEKYGIHFIDSRTTAQTKAPTVSHNFGLKYVARDVFLDHHQDKAYVLGQIKQAIKVAKAHGSAIAIGHPHKNTLEALRESKALLNKEVELVLIKDL